jgi:uncharacterized protein with HEPN domain
VLREALRRLDERDHETASKITDFKQIIGFRNILIHGYSLLNHDRVWKVVEHHLPTLLTEVKALLATPPANSDHR